MLVLAINGSPRPEGNTAYLLRSLQSVVEGAGAQFLFLQVSKILAEQKVPYCTACSSPCAGKCYRGTYLEEVLQLMRKADGIIVGSPVYFSTVSAPLKAFWDKTRS
ncbi:MAG: flavodoxin family protein, partial [Desulfotomaculales bacterium]